MAYITNTLPGNIKMIGMINLCLPQAKIIWLDRELNDTCFEIYKQDFAEGHGYSNDLKILGEHARMVYDLMEYWDQLLPGFIYRLKFEDLISDPQQQIPRLMNFCGLGWKGAQQENSPDSGANEFSDIDSIPTLENVIGVWKPYAKYLAPLFDALEQH